MKKIRLFNNGITILINSILGILLSIVIVLSQNSTYYYTDKLFDTHFSFTPKTDELMVKFVPQPKGLQKATIENAVRELNVEIVHDAIEIYQFGVYKIPTGTSMEDALKRVKSNPAVQAVSPVMIDQEGNTRYFIPDEFTLLFKEDIEKDEALDIIENFGCQIKKKHYTPGYYTLSVPYEKDLFDMIRSFIDLPQVKFAELSFIEFDLFKFDPNDTFYAQQWALYNAGTGGGTTDADIDAREAWDIERGEPNVLIVIIDSGTDWDHPDLRPNIFQNLGEDADGDGHTIESVAGNWVLDPGDLDGNDNDGNGWDDDLIGWDFLQNDNNPEENTAHWGQNDGAHGTACAGIAGAVTDNSDGVAGVAHGCRIMPIALNFAHADLADAIHYAADFMNVFDGVVLSCSWSTSNSTTLHNAVINAKNAGAVVCVAAGNNNTTPIRYPARYVETIAIGATNEDDDRCDPSDWSPGRGSNFGNNLNISAPGVNTYTTDITGANGYSGTDYTSSFGGTSGATPHVAATAALLISHNERINPGTTLTPDEIQDIIQTSADKVGGYNYNHDPTRPGHSLELGYGRLNTNRALQELIARSVIELQPTPADIVLSVDRSGSMTTPKLNAAKNAASQVVRLMNLGDRIAVTSFSTTTTTEFPLTEITTEAIKTNAIATINSVAVHPSPDIFTSIGGGLVTAQGQFLLAIPPYYPQAIILMSDGMSNRPPFIQPVLPAIPATTDVYTIGFATAATNIDEDSLQLIASETGGTYFFAGADGFSSSFQDTDNLIAQSSGGLDLIKSYQASLNMANQRENLILASLPLKEGIFQDSVWVDSSVDEMRFSLLWEEAVTVATIFTLISPSGRLINPNEAGVDPLIDYIEDVTVASYTIRRPEKGTWLLRITAHRFGRYFISASVYSHLKSRLSIKNPGTALPLIFELKLIERGLPIIGATVKAKVGFPNNEYSAMDLFDDGLHQDGLPNDGLYANYYSNTSREGSYSVEAFARGISNISGDKFHRYSVASTFLKTDPDSNAIKVAMPNKIVPPQRNVKIPIYINTDVFGRSINLYRANFIYDPQILVPTGEFETAGTMSSNWTVNLNITQSGLIKVSGKGPDLQGNGILLNLLFNVIGNYGETSLLRFTGFAFNNGTIPVNLTDGSLKVGDTFLEPIEFPFALQVKKVHAWPGEQHVRVPIFMTNQDSVGGWEILMQYDITGATVVGVELCDSIYVHDLNHQGWHYAPWAHYPKLKPEYFNYVLEADCHKDWLRTVGIMNMDFPQPLIPDIPPGQQWLLFCLIVNVSPNWSGHEVMFNFITKNCTDNTLASSDGYTLWGPDILSSPRKICPERLKNLRIIRLMGGAGIGVPKVLIGDINLNGIPYEVGDAILFINYLVHGSSVLIDPPQQTATSDVNKDGYPWTIADLVTLINIINGYEQPTLAKIPSTSVNTVKVGIPAQPTGEFGLTTDCDVPIGGAYFIFKYDKKNLELGTPILSKRGQEMTLVCHDDKDELRVVIYSLEKKMIDVGEGTLFTIPFEGKGTLSIHTAEFSDTLGNLLEVQTSYNDVPAELPSVFSLAQNYPNPFNIETTISFALPREVEVNMRIYNITGQLIRTLINRRMEAGQYRMNWDGKDDDGSVVSSGIYFYQIIADDFIASKKMVMMK